MTASGVEKRVNRSLEDVDVHRRNVLAAPGVHTRERIWSKVREPECEALELDGGRLDIRRLNKTGDACQYLVFGIIIRVRHDEEDAGTPGVNAIDIARTATVLGDESELDGHVGSVHLDNVIHPECEWFTRLNAESPLAGLRLPWFRFDRELAAPRKGGYDQEQHEGEVSHEELYTQSHRANRAVNTGSVQPAGQTVLRRA